MCPNEIGVECDTSVYLFIIRTRLHLGKYSHCMIFDLPLVFTQICLRYETLKKPV